MNRTRDSKYLLLIFIVLIAILISLFFLLKDNNNENTSNKEDILIESINLEEENIELYIGESKTINYEVIPSNATNIKLTWVSSNSEIATVENGVIKGINEGGTVITVKTSNNIEANISVKVIKKSNKTGTFKFEKSSETIINGQSKTLKVNNTSNNNITCSSKDTTIAEVESKDNSCIVYGRSYGSTTIYAKSKNKETSIKINVNNKSITSNDFLKVDGTKFVKVSNNKTVLLRGFNIGEWLSRAISLTPISKASSETDPWKREYPDNNLQINYMLTKRFGLAKTYELNELYYSNFINSSDLDKIASTGANVVRVPVEWSYFVDLTFNDAKKDQNGNYGYSYTLLSGSKLEQRLKHLDWILKECGNRGIYVIFDLHVVDGGQNNGGIRSKRGGYTFFNDTKAQNNAIEIWKLISNRYKNNPTVAAYELLNEPAASEAELIPFYRKAYNAIRSTETSSKYKHIIIMETPMKGVTGHSIKGLNKPSLYGFTNVAYSIHDYFTSDNSILPGNTVAGKGTANDVKKAIKAKVDKDVSEMKEYNIPIYIGETNFLWKDVDDVWKYAMSYYDSNLISYSLWTYKTAKSTSYGLIYNLDSQKYPNSLADLVNDSYDTISEIFKLTTNTGNYTLNKYYKVIRNNFARNNQKSIIATSKYECSVGNKLTTTVKSFSNDGETTLLSLNTSNDNVKVNKINSTGVICTGTSCQTLEIECNKKGTTTLEVISTNNRKSTATITIK